VLSSDSVPLKRRLVLFPPIPAPIRPGIKEDEKGDARLCTMSHFRTEPNTISQNAPRIRELLTPWNFQQSGLPTDVQMPWSFHGTCILSEVNPRTTTSTRFRMERWSGITYCYWPRAHIGKFNGNLLVASDNSPTCSL